MTEMLPSDQSVEQLNQEEALSLSGAELLRALEAMLFVACEPLTSRDLAKVLELRESEVKEALAQLELDYQQRGVDLRRVAGGWQLVTPERYAPLVERLYRPKFQQLSASAMETLAVVAYKQPVTRAEVSAIRQVDSDHMIGKLLEKKLICEVGRVSGAGRAILYGTSSDFLSFFGIDSLSDLPQLGPEEGPQQEALPL